MPTLQGSALIDRNHRTVAVDGATSYTGIVPIASTGTVVKPIFSITGSVEIRALWLVVTTALGVNHTASAFRLNDQTAQVNITLNTGTDISAAPAGTIVVKKGLAAAAVTLLSSSAGRVSEPTTLETTFYSPFIAVQKTAAVETDIEYVYATTDNPTTGAIQFYCRWLPLTNGSKVTPLL